MPTTQNNKAMSEVPLKTNKQNPGTLMISFRLSSSDFFFHNSSSTDFFSDNSSNSNMVMEWLDGIFEERMLAIRARRGDSWAPSSPDMNPCDSFLWGYLK